MRGVRERGETKKENYPEKQKKKKTTYKDWSKEDGVSKGDN